MDPGGSIAVFPSKGTKPSRTCPPRPTRLRDQLQREELWHGAGGTRAGLAAPGLLRACREGTARYEKRLEEAAFGRR